MIEAYPCQAICNSIRFSQSCSSKAVKILLDTYTEILLVWIVENHAPNVDGQVRGGEGYKRVGNNYKNSYYIYQNKTITKCGVDMPSEPNSEIPTYLLKRRQVNNNANKISNRKKRRKRDTPSNWKPTHKTIQHNLKMHVLKLATSHYMPTWPLCMLDYLPNPTSVCAAATCPSLTSHCIPWLPATARLLILDNNSCVYWNKKNGSELIDPKYILIYSTKWSVHSKFN